MRKILNTLFTLLVFTSVSFAQKLESDLVKEALKNYKSATLNNNGAEAIKYLDSKTRRHYQKMIDVVQNADSAQVEDLSLTDKLMVLTIRHKATKEEILSFKEDDLLLYAVNNGMVGKNSADKGTLGKVFIDKNFAKINIEMNGKATPLNFHFYKEEGQWKVDITALFPVSNMLFKKLIEDAEVSENDFLFNILEMLTGKEPRNSIWHPVRA